MLTIVWIVFAIMTIYFLIGMIGIIIWEIVTDIKGIYDIPSWLDNVYKFIIEKMFFFFK